MELAIFNDTIRYDRRD